MRLGDYLNGMNLFIEVADHKINPLDNPYFEIKSYVVDNVKTDRERDPVGTEVKLVKCDKKVIQTYA